MGQTVREAAQAVMEAVNNGDYKAYEKELEKYDAIVEQAIENGMELEEVQAIEDEIGFIA